MPYYCETYYGDGKECGNPAKRVTEYGFPEDYYPPYLCDECAKKAENEGE